MHQGSRGLTTAERWTLRVAPGLGVATVVACTLGFTEPDSRWAQIYTGPTDQPGAPSTRNTTVTQAWRIAVMSNNPTRAPGSAAEGLLRLSFGASSPVEIPFRADAEGIAWIAVNRAELERAASIEAEVSERGRLLARGLVKVPLARWAAGKRSEGGWCTGVHEGPVEIRLGIIDGVLLHGYPSTALVSLRENGSALADQPVLLESEGARIVSGLDTSKVMLTSDANGLVRLQLQPTDLAATLTVRLPEPKSSRLMASLPIRAGGLRAFRNADRIIVSTSIPTARAWIGLLTERGLTRVQSLPLEASAGNWTASAPFADWPEAPLWAVVSAEPELESTNTLGWPLLDGRARDQAHATLVVPNVLALDGKTQVQLRIKKQRQRAAVASGIVLLVVAALVAWVVLRSNHRHQQQVRGLAQLVEGAQAPALADRTPLALMAILVTTTALFALAFWLAL